MTKAVFAERFQQRTQLERSLLDFEADPYEIIAIEPQDQDLWLKFQGVRPTPGSDNKRKKKQSLECLVKHGSAVHRRIFGADDMDVDRLKQFFRSSPRRLRVIPGAEHQVYAVATGRFQITDIVEYRNQVLGLMEREGFPLGEHEGLNGYIQTALSFRDAGEQLSEFFQVPEESYGLRALLEVQYPANDGVTGFKARLHREVIICTNGLRRITGDRFYLGTHVSNLEGIVGRLQSLLPDIPQIVIGAGLALHRSRTIPFSVEQTEAEIRELRLYAATEDRIRNRLKHEVESTGLNLYSFCQALTFCGTHEIRAIVPKVRLQLVNRASNLIDMLDAA